MKSNIESRSAWWPRILILTLTLVSAIYAASIGGSGQITPVSIIHFNDFHARFEETNMQSKTCKRNDTCIGGLARMATVIKTLKEIRKNTNPIVLNAGDNYQGTLFYTLGRWDITQHFMNIILPDAMVLGNHEFDNGIKGLLPYMNCIKFPVVVSNIDDSMEPEFQRKYTKSIVIDKYQQKIGIVGVANSHYNEMTNIGNLKMLDECESVRLEAAKLKSQGVNIIIVLSHSGVDVDKVIAVKGGPDISMIVGGHTHTYMYTGPNPPGPDIPESEYPTVVENAAGHKVPIVQASALAKFVGDVTVWFNEDGKAVSWQGDPIFLANGVEQDQEILDNLKPWKKFIDDKGHRVVGHSDITMNRLGCNSGECTLGNFFTDIFVQYYAIEEPKAADEWTSSSVAILNTGGLRTTIEKGDITYADLISTIPFENSVDLIDLRGDHLLEALEYSVSKNWTGPEFTSINMLQVSGLKVVFNVSKPSGQRVQSVEVLCNKCKEPEFEPLEKDKLYRIITISFLCRGGDGFTAISDNKLNHKFGPVDNDIVTNYLKTPRSFKIAANEPRIVVLQ